MERPLFLTKPLELQQLIFSPSKAKLTLQTVLNVTYLPDLLQFVKQQLLPDELLRLEDYSLQNYLLELSSKYDGRKELHELSSSILVHIRSNQDFWQRQDIKELTKEEEQKLTHQAIKNYQRDIAHLHTAFKLEDNTAEYVQTYGKKSNTHSCFRLMRNRTEQYSVGKNNINHLAYIPGFLITREQQNIKVQLVQNDSQKDSPKIWLEQTQYQNQRELQVVMRECILFLLNNKPQNAEKGAASMIIQGQKGQNEIEQSCNLQDKNSITESLKSNHRQKVLIDEFVSYLSKFRNMPRFHNNSHMYYLTHNLLLVCHRLQSNKASFYPQLRDIKPTFKRHQLKDSADLLEIPEQCSGILSKLIQKKFTERQSQILADCFLQLWQSKLVFLHQDIQSKLQTCSLAWCNQNQLLTVRQLYKGMLCMPEYLELNEFKAIDWEENHYKLFLEGLAKFINNPNNNQKIAGFMGDQINSNHVKQVKKLYLTAMKARMDRGECGGGKRGKCMSKSEFLERDITSFSMKWFHKSKKIKRSSKRKHRNSSDEEEEVDDASEY